MLKAKPTTKVLVAVFAASAGARVIDLALVGSSIGAALGSVAFAGYMVAQGDHSPRINGMEYLAIFAKPNGGHVADPTPDAVDMAPIGAVASKAASGASGYSLVAAQPDLAWLREGDRIFSIKPGQFVPRLGVIASIVWRDSRWTLFNASGAPLILGARIELSKATPGPFARPMIFGERK